MECPSRTDKIIDAPDEDNFEAQVEQDKQAKLAEKIVSELGDRCQEILMLFYQSKMSLKDIALKMGYNSENTAKNQKYKCLEAAKKNLKEAMGKQFST